MTAAESAILRLAQTRAAVDALSRQIGNALGGCAAQHMRAATGTDFVPHLKNAYEITYGEDDDGSPEVYFDHHDGDVGAYLSAIRPYCLAAHQAIQERKLARQQYGIAKRRVSAMGTRMLKAQTKGKSA